MDPKTQPTPIPSLFTEDPNLQPLIDGFVIGLGEHVDSLQEAELAENFTRLCELAKVLNMRAAEAGYPPLAESAALVIEAGAQRDGRLVHKRLEELTEICLRIRLGHRSSA